MYRKWFKRDCASLRLALHITQVHKYGKTSHMVQNLIYGRWDVLFMS
jgi:hypothetical protein